MIQDHNVDMVSYMHPNRGQHPVYGMATKKFYGMRSGGGTETFLVHKADIAAAPHYFHLVPQTPQAPQKAVVIPPAPERLVSVPPPPMFPGTTHTFDSGPPPPVMKAEQDALSLDGLPEGSVVREDGVIEIPQNPDPMQRAINNARFDLQLLPGVTPNIVKGLADANLNSVEKILSGGIEALQGVRGVGPARAEAIYEYVSTRYGG